MEWTAEAETAIKKVPVFVRKRVRVRVEKEAADAGTPIVTLAEVKTTQARFLAGMSSDVQGYQTEICFGPNGCPNRANPGDRLLERIDSLLNKADLLTFLKKSVEGDLKYHHNFRVAVSDCPNACSQPQIKDIGIIGACGPRVTDAACTRCDGCIDACKEAVVSIDDTCEHPAIDLQSCVKCGKCIDACPTGTIAQGERGYRIQLGGKLGRHPQLARELPGIYSEDQVVDIVGDCIRLYKQNSRRGQRFAEIFTDEDFQRLRERYTEDSTE